MEGKKRSPWVSFIVMFITGAVFAMGQFKVSPLMVDLMNNLGFDTTLGGLLMSVVSISAIFLSLFGGLLMVRIHPKKLLIFAMCCAVVGNFGGAIAGGFSTLIVFRFIEGLGYGLVGVTAPTLISMWFDDRNAARAMAIWAMWVPVGMLIIMNGAVPFSGAFGSWRAVWIAMGVIFVIMLILVILFLDGTTNVFIENAASDTRSEGTGKLILAELKNPAMWMLTLVFTVYGMGCASSMTWGPTFCQQNLGMGEAIASSSMGMKTFGMIAGGFVMTAILSKWSKKSKILMIVISCCTAVMFGISFQLWDSSQVIPFALVDGLILQGIPPLVLFLGPRTARTPQTIGAAVGIANAGDHLGSFIGNVAIGAIAENANHVWSACTPWMIGFAALAIIGAIGFSVITRGKVIGNDTVAGE